MSEYYAIVRSGAEDSLQHFGVLGMRWGVPYLGLGVQGASWAYYTKNRQARKNKKR